MKKYLLNESDRRELARLITKDRSGPPRPLIPESQKIVIEEGDSYWALPPCETGIPAAERVNGKLHTVGIQCCLFRHAWGADEMEALLDPVGNPIRVTVWNYYERRENGLIQVYKHKDGTWTNERPEVISSATSTQPPEGTTVPPLRPDPTCQGECFWQANGDAVWQWPTGGCANATTTSTTTTTSSTTTTTTSSPGLPGGTRYPEPPPATLAPCTATKCTLVCVDTSTTPAPVGGIEVPYSRLRYQLKSGSVCPEGCTCYGLDDPCFLVDGELVSRCIGLGPTTTSTTTPSPDAAPCVQAAFIFGTVPPQIYRAATANNGATDWQTCGTCAPGTEPLYPLGGEVYRRHDWRNLGTVYETPCVQGPCGFAPAPAAADNAVFVAWPWQTQVDKWGYTTGATFYDRLGSRPKFLANWFYCRKCAENMRPDLPPPVWIYEDEALNARNGVFFNPDNGTYVFQSKCISGYSCDTCGRAPTRRVWEYQGPPTSAPPTTTGTTTTGTTTTGTTTTGTTTTAAPNCGCIRPAFCPRPYECFRGPCERGGEVVNGTPNPATTVKPPVPCFPDSTTTLGPPPTTIPPGTTSQPYQCYDSYGNLCNCAGGPGPGTTLPPTNTTSQPCGGTCGPGLILVQLGDKCSAPICVATLPPPDTTSPPPLPPCGGGCVWEAQAAPGCNDPPPVWVLLSNSCAGGSICSCDAPGAPGACGAIKFTGCTERDPPQPPPTTLPPLPCSCCRPTTTANPCNTGNCRYASNSSNGWTLVSNTCRNNCPCPDPGGLPPPGNTCSSFNLPCGHVLPPTSPPPTTTGTTTTGNPMGCCSFAATGGGCYQSSRSACLASGGQHSVDRVCTRLGDGNLYCIQSTTTTTGAPGCCLYNLGRNGYLGCAVVTRDHCIAAYSGTWTANASCQTIDARTGEKACQGATTTTVGPLRGACCFLYAGSGTYSCMEGSTDAGCAGLGGIFYVNTSCLSNPCPPGTSTSTSTTTTTLAPCPCPYLDCSCPSALGASPSCAPPATWNCTICGCATTVPPTTTTGAPLGKCCVGTSCSDVTAAACSAAGGTWSGAGTFCNPMDPCGPGGP